ncbi:MAG: MucR family transcriptional regulator [Rhodospirillaceae bacterium]|jgi:predicted transcriptional regulator|nr:MucR family transcriptional regulator [Rhodospirillaceae bacterium]MBT4489051.1 MucR family transcriptional regulator [Rhodospirillaceae bacterium]MBT5895932.1 MucR family transcriptional regulator [Rhodospirillaceae bacterium]MBT6430756.1 MucR family transcriptional regulator [Rhodospirillaceae bacterium]MBT7756018.1 MucR family transcriptional regulator [Rhodospirillaceae bacterium]
MDQQSNAGLSRDEMRRLAADVVSAYVSYNTMPNSELPALIQTVHGALVNAGKAQTEQPVEAAPKPAVPVRRSIQEDYIICLEDGKKLKMLKRYLRTRYNLTPDEYRRKWGLASDYPMVAPSYSSLRSNFAKEIGLGRARNAT